MPLVGVSSLSTVDMCFVRWWVPGICRMYGQLQCVQVEEWAGVVRAVKEEDVIVDVS
jgi:hypothetical protein